MKLIFLLLINLILINYIYASEILNDGKIYGYNIRNYNYINIEEVYKLEEFSKRYTVTAGDITVVKNNLLLGVYTPECKDKLLSFPFLGSQRSVGKNLLISSIPSSEFSLPLSEGVCAEAFFYHSGDYITHPKSRNSDLEYKSFSRWVAATAAIPNLNLVNSFQFPIAVYSHNESISPNFLLVLSPGQSIIIKSQLGQVYSASKLDNTEYEIINKPFSEQEAFLKPKGYDNIVDYFFTNGVFYGFRPENRLFTCEFDSINPPKSILGTTVDLNCNDMLTRFTEYSQKHWYVRRLALNFIQPKVIPSVTNDGFRLIKLPSDTYAWLKDWYDKEQLSKELVEFSAGPCMNQKEAPTFVTHLSPELKHKLSKELSPILEDWYAKGPLTLTSIYGIRKYVNGSELKMHVDTLNTHVVSAIINVDQNVDEDWKLLILDHDDNEHYVIMEKGDMLLYESAKLLHGRPDKFKGNHYDNIFIHFKPVTGWNYSL